MKVLFFASFLFFHLAIALPPYPEGQHPLRNHDRHESPDVNVQCFDTFLESAGSNNIVCVSAIVNPPADTFGTASTQFSGYVDLRRADQAKLFFWLVMSEDNPAKDPVVLWMNGGPGASSLLGLFDQWGPKTFDHSKNPATLVKNPYRVTEKLTWIFLEQPVRVGFSSARDPVTDTPNAAMDVFSFLNGVMRTRFRVGTKDVILLGRDFHIAGESYAGHWIPAVAALIVSTGWVDLKLKSIIIGNGMIDVALLPDGVNNLFCANPPSLNIDPNQQDAAAVAARCGQMDAWGQACQLAITNCRTALVADKPARCVGVMNVCEDTLGWRWGGFADTDPYDFLTSAANGRDRFTFYTNRMATFMNDAARKTAIAADNIQWRYTANGMIGNFHASGDWVRDFSPEIQQVLNQGSIDVLLYAGDQDLTVPYLTVKATANALDWTDAGGAGTEQRDKMRRCLLQPDANYRKLSLFLRRDYGSYVRSGRLTFARIYGAGHMINERRAEEAKDMFETWISNRKGFAEKDCP